MEDKFYIVGDGNGSFLLENGEKKLFNNIGDAMRACIAYNKNYFTFRVFPYVERKK